MQKTRLLGLIAATLVTRDAVNAQALRQIGDRVVVAASGGFATLANPCACDDGRVAGVLSTQIGVALPRWLVVGWEYDHFVNGTFVDQTAHLATVRFQSALDEWGRWQVHGGVGNSVSSLRKMPSRLQSDDYDSHGAAAEYGVGLDFRIWGPLHAGPSFTTLSTPRLETTRTRCTLPPRLYGAPPGTCVTTVEHAQFSSHRFVVSLTWH